MLSIKRKRLINGVRVLTVPMKGTRAVTVLILVKCGSKYEAAEISGASHFLEHLFFKGSKNYPTPRALSEALDRLGAEFNAFTGTEETGYWVKTAQSNAEKAVAIVADMLKHPKFSATEMDRERGAIMEEFNMNRDNPMRHIFWLWQRVLYGDQPAGREILGTPETITSMTRAQIKRHFTEHYRGEGVVVCLTGAVTHAGGQRLIEKHFKGLNEGVGSRHEPIKEAQKSPGVLVHKKKTDQTHIAIGFRGVSMTHPKRHAVAVLATILGGMMSSRMFMTVREKLGLAYSVRTMADFDTETGSIVTVAGVRNDAAMQAIKAILGEYRRIMKQAPPAEEVRKTKDSMVGRFVLSLEETDEVASYVAMQELLLDEVKMPEQEISAIRRVTPTAIRDAARMLFTPESLNLAIIGPNENAAKWEKLLRGFSVSRKP